MLRSQVRLKTAMTTARSTDLWSRRAMDVTPQAYHTIYWHHVWAQNQILEQGPNTESWKLRLLCPYNCQYSANNTKRSKHNIIQVKLVKIVASAVSSVKHSLASALISLPHKGTKKHRQLQVKHFNAYNWEANMDDEVHNGGFFWVVR